MNLRCHCSEGLLVPEEDFEIDVEATTHHTGRPITRVTAGPFFCSECGCVGVYLHPWTLDGVVYGDRTADHEVDGGCEQHCAQEREAARERAAEDRGRD